MNDQPPARPSPAWRKKLLLALAVLLLVLAASYAGIHFYLNSSAFHQKLIAACRDRMGCELRLQKSIPNHSWKIYFRGNQLHILGALDLEDVILETPEPDRLKFLHTRLLRLRYQALDAVFHGKVRFEEIKLIEPRIRLPDDTLAFSPEIPTEKKTSARSTPSPKRPPSSSSSSPIEPARDAEVPIQWPRPPSLDLPRFVVEKGTLLLPLQNKQSLSFNHIDGQVSFETQPVASAVGSLKMDSIRFADFHAVSNASLSFLWRPDSIVIPSFQAEFMTGNLMGDIRLDESYPRPQFKAAISLENFPIEKLRTYWKTNYGEFRGNLEAHVSLHGPAIQSHRVGCEGELILHQGRLIQLKFFSLASAFLNRPDLLDLPLQKCEADFILRHPKIDISRLEVIAKDLQLSGSGQVQMPTQSISMDLKLAIGKPLQTVFPESFWEGATRRSDGFMEIPFRIWGPLNHPQNDLEGRFKSIATQAVGGAIFNRIFDSLPETQAK